MSQHLINNTSSKYILKDVYASAESTLSETNISGLNLKIFLVLVLLIIGFSFGTALDLMAATSQAIFTPSIWVNPFSFVHWAITGSKERYMRPHFIRDSAQCVTYPEFVGGKFRPLFKANIARIGKSGSVELEYYFKIYCCQNILCSGAYRY